PSVNRNDRLAPKSAPGSGFRASLASSGRQGMPRGAENRNAGNGSWSVLEYAIDMEPDGTAGSVVVNGSAVTMVFFTPTYMGNLSAASLGPDSLSAIGVDDVRLRD